MQGQELAAASADRRPGSLFVGYECQDVEGVRSWLFQGPRAAGALAVPLGV
jgi:hypothetical protein